MLQQVMTAPGVIEFREVPIPEPKAGEVLVKIMRIGVCGSDIHVYHGEHPFTKYPVPKATRCRGRLPRLERESPASGWDSVSPSSHRWYAAGATPAAMENTISARNSR